MLENNGFQKVPWIIYPLRSYHCWHDGSKQLASCGSEAPLRDTQVGSLTGKWHFVVYRYAVTNAVFSGIEFVVILSTVSLSSARLYRRLLEAVR
jgi:hypothetical protein